MGVRQGTQGSKFFLLTDIAERSRLFEPSRCTATYLAECREIAHHIVTAEDIGKAVNVRVGFRAFLLSGPFALVTA